MDKKETQKRNFPTISLRFPPKIKKTIEEVSKKDRRLAGPWLEMYVIDHMKGEGLLSDEDLDGL